MESNDVNVFVSYCITACQNKIIRAGFKGGKLGSCPGPPQLVGPPQNSKKYYLRKHKNTV